MIQTPEGQEGEKRAENLWEEIMATNFSSLKMETDNKIQDSHRVLKKIH